MLGLAGGSDFEPSCRGRDGAQVARRGATTPAAGAGDASTSTGAAGAAPEAGPDAGTGAGAGPSVTVATGTTGRGRRGSRRRRRTGCGRRIGRWSSGPRGQQRQRVEVALLLRRQAHAEVDIRLRQLGIAARPDRRRPRAPSRRRALGDGDRAEMGERDRVSVRRLDRDALARRRTEPANVDRPAAGASTVEPAAPPTSMPRCCPAAYGCAGSKRNGCRTAPVQASVHALAAGASRSAASDAGRSARRIGHHLCCLLVV